MGENFSTATPVLRQDRANVLAIEGDIDLHISPAITEALNAIIKKKPERIVIDLSRATYIDSAGVAALILAMREVKEYGGGFFFCGGGGNISLVFVNFRGVWKFFFFSYVNFARAANAAGFSLLGRAGRRAQAKKVF